MLGEIGFRNVSVEDVSTDWGSILQERFAMYRELREATLRLGTPSGDQEFYRAYGRLVALVQEGTLGGGSRLKSKCIVRAWWRRSRRGPQKYNSAMKPRRQHALVHH